METLAVIVAVVTAGAIMVACINSATEIQRLRKELKHKEGMLEVVTNSRDRLAKDVHLAEAKLANWQKWHDSAPYQP